MCAAPVQGGRSVVATVRASRWEREEKPCALIGPRRASPLPPREVHNDRLAWVEDALSAAIERAAPGEDFRPFVLMLTDDADARRGGLVAYASWDWLVIDSLGVDEGFRARGWGRRLVERAEAEGRARGCVRATLETFTAEGFYAQTSDRTIAQLEDYPPGRAFSRMVKAPL